MPGKKQILVGIAISLLAMALVARVPAVRKLVQGA